MQEYINLIESPYLLNDNASATRWQKHFLELLLIHKLAKRVWTLVTGLKDIAFVIFSLMEHWSASEHGFANK